MAAVYKQDEGDIYLDGEHLPSQLMTLYLQHRGAMTAIEQQNRTDIQLITGMGGTVSALNEIKADNTQNRCAGC